MKKALTMEIADLERELANLQEARREADEEWRAVDAEYVKLKRQLEQLDAHKRDLWYEIECRKKYLAALQVAKKYEPASA
ncbi:hypothetical protein NDK47_17935 [Brevibacillus ruminantium]|uniref:Uncharacterized protein n=1 Tax=Brevibacillus ruminantium TaxID=2950604 RepID=A0ABY4WH97_9BACL|nr:hypothetical protein [Brevibacillus ruminantium]USG64031.1 hypothetical protein NDK47_17935 [Brevibacillus ruminantium]